MAGNPAAKIGTWILKLSTGSTSRENQIGKYKGKMKIKPLLIVVFIATLAINKHSVGQSAVGGMQTAPATQNAPVVTQNASAVRFLAPQPGEKLQQIAVTVRYAVDQPQVVAASTPSPDDSRSAQDANLPESASTLPLLTMIGAGVLIGGLFSARKTRRAKMRRSAQVP